MSEPRIQYLSNEVAFLKQQLNEAHEKYKIALNVLMDCFVIFSAIRDAEERIIDFRFESINQAASEFLGVPIEEASNFSLLELYPGYVESGLFDRYCEVVLTNRPAVLETSTYNRDGELSYIKVSVAKLTDGVVVSWDDITMERKLEEELDKNLSKLAIVLSSMSDGFAIFDQNWRFLYINPKIEELLNKSKLDLLGRNLFRVFPEFINSTIFDFIQVLSQARLSNSTECLDPINNTYYDITAYPYEDGYAVIVRDITAKKELQLAAKRSEELFFKSFHLSPAMMCLISVEKRTVLDVNDAWCFFTGYTKDEVIGQCTDVLTVFSNHYPIDSDVLDSGSSGSRSNFKVKCLTKQGHIRELIHSSEIIEVTGEMCFLYVALDVTENEKLTREIARLDKLNLIGQMAAGIGHEIRNPLTTVRGFLQFMMSKEYFANHSHHFELMISELDRANHIITEFLSLAGYKHYDRQSHNINLLVENIFPLLQSEALKENKNISFLLEDIPKVDINEMEFRQLILNLVKNGFEAIDSGGCVKIQTYSTVHSVVLRIEDTGHGIPSDVLGKLGTPFFTTKSHGTGLGLAVCYSIVERHNGRIDVASNEHGTSFTIHFPLP